MAAAEHLEIERKFDVDESTRLPDMVMLPGVVRVAPATEHRLEAAYFDTADLSLAKARVTLRRRTGGDDAGWHLKLPSGLTARTELHAPLGNLELGSVPEPVPVELLTPVRVLVRDHPLVPVATVSTRRLVHRLIGVDKVVLAEVCDDQVTAVVPGVGVRVDSWREWEVELVNGDEELLEAAGSLLTEAGAGPSPFASKLVRALGDRAPVVPRGSAALPARPTAGEVLITFLQNEMANVRRLDPAFRADAAGDTEALHDLRVAVRRLRSALATHRSLLDGEVVAELRDELKWVGSVLGEPRDAQVLRAALRDAVAAEPTGLGNGPVSKRVDQSLGQTYDATRQTALDTLDGARYFRLLDRLDGVVSSPGFTKAGRRPARKVVPGLVRHEWRRLAKAARSADRLTDSGDRSVALHEVRKAAKRLRYAADAAEPFVGKKAARLSKAAKHLQTILGEQHDAVVQLGVLQRLAADADAAGESSFTFGRLHALAQVRADDAATRYRSVWAALSAPSFGRW